MWGETDKQNRGAFTEVLSRTQQGLLLHGTLISSFKKKMLWLWAPYLRSKAELVHKGREGDFGRERSLSQGACKQKQGTGEASLDLGSSLLS